ncbi:MAG TPA: hypothetical protein DEA95_06935 [Nitrospiraceae bacterium]|nr:MAG: hypothetical protein A2471_04290 [Omnitrophica WOR_2 bacterium RIFOXYC2_FULL_45_15]HBU06290.1 hypothetical protein [Nitrospiraceae bacterium]
MSTLKSYEKIIFERLFDRGGYVLTFNDKTFSEFFREHGVLIDQEKYRFNGVSKMKRLRAFWEIESDVVVGKVLEALLEYASAIGPVDVNDRKKALEIIGRLLGKPVIEKSEVQSEQAFLQQDFHKIDWLKLNIEPDLQVVIEQRICEIGKTLKADASLAVVFLCGSTLEGLLLDVAIKNAAKFNSAKVAPKNKEGKVKLLHDWTLDNLINVAYEVDLLSLDVKKHSHSLRGFRNYIHPREQVSQRFTPDQHTARISWQVLQAAIANLSGQRK